MAESAVTNIDKTTTPANIRTKTQRSVANPKELDDFCDLLRDRYDGKRSLRAAFLNWDRDKDGRLSGKEVREMINTLGFATRLGPEKVEGVIQHIKILPSSCVLQDHHWYWEFMRLTIFYLYVPALKQQESPVRGLSWLHLWPHRYY